MAVLQNDFGSYFGPHVTGISVLDGVPTAKAASSNRLGFPTAPKSPRGEAARGAGRGTSRVKLGRVE